MVGNFAGAVREIFPELVEFILKAQTVIRFPITVQFSAFTPDANRNWKVGLF